MRYVNCVIAKDVKKGDKTVHIIRTSTREEDEVPINEAPKIMYKLMGQTVENESNHWSIGDFGNDYVYYVNEVRSSSCREGTKFPPMEQGWKPTRPGVPGPRNEVQKKRGEKEFKGGLPKISFHKTKYRKKTKTLDEWILLFKDKKVKEKRSAGTQVVIDPKRWEVNTETPLDQLGHVGKMELEDLIPMCPQCPPTDMDFIVALGSKARVWPVIDCECKKTLKHLQIEWKDNNFTFFLEDQGFICKVQKTFKPEDQITGNFSIREVRKEDAIYNERYAFFDGDDRLSHVYSMGGASPYSVAYVANQVRASVAGANRNYFQGGSCASSAEPLQVGLLVLLNIVTPEVAVETINEISVIHQKEIDVKVSLRGSDIGLVLKTLFDSIEDELPNLSQEKHYGNCFIETMVRYSTGSPFNLRNLKPKNGEIRADEMDWLCDQVCANITKRTFFDPAESHESKAWINGTFNSDEYRLQSQKYESGATTLNDDEEGIC